MTVSPSTDNQNQTDKNLSIKADEVLQRGHKRFDRVFENEGGKIISIHCDTLELCILKNQKSSIWEKLCLGCSPVAISFFICIVSTKEFNGESAYWAGFLMALTILFAVIGIACGVAWYCVDKSKMHIYDAIKTNCIDFSIPIKLSDTPNNSDATTKTQNPTDS